MKRCVFILLFLLINSFAFSQQETINRLKSRLQTNTDDFTKGEAYDSLSMYYLFFTNQPDSSFHYAHEFINFGFEITDKKYLIQAYARMGFYYQNIDLFKDALTISLKGINLCEEYHNSDFLASLYYNLAGIYINLTDNKTALENAFKGLSHVAESKDRFYDQALHLNGLISNVYVMEGNSDSAFYYCQKTDSLAKISIELAAVDIADYYWAIYYLYKKDYHKTDSIIADALPRCNKDNDFLLADFLIFSSQSFLGEKKMKEAIYTAHQAFARSLDIKESSEASGAAYQIYLCFEALKKQDSAYYYLKTKDSIDNIIHLNNNSSEIQQIGFERQLGIKEQEAMNTLQSQRNRSRMIMYIFLTVFLFFLILAWAQWRNNWQKKKANKLLMIEKEKVETALTELKAAQKLLIQSEKMASLGQLTAGIAHEIQNPLNFVNNFSEVNEELAEELTQALATGNPQLAAEIAHDIKDNAKKIGLHGKRADAIVKGMLQHSQSSTGVKELTNINAMCEEYMRLAYHGQRSKNSSFHATVKTNFDNGIEKINIIPQDFGKVLLNLFNNAFYAVIEKTKEQHPDYVPTVSVNTKKTGRQLSITVNDNGVGMPQKILDKIFQPFFTTKPTGQGAGLGLSLSYDIINAHGGELKVETLEGEGSTFIIELPLP